MENLNKLKMPKLLDIKVYTLSPGLVRHDKKHWRLTSPFYADFLTDQGVWKLRLSAGWITDKRSGSSTVDWFFPKDGNPLYRACIFAHDSAYSGLVSKALADHLFILQGTKLSGEVNAFQASVAHKAVSLFGKAYELDDEMPEPYKNNRAYERLYLAHK